jgi:hypothetical protein
MIITGEGYGLGWLPDHPDFRDHTPHHGKAPAGEKRDVPALLSQLGVAEPASQLAPSVDLRGSFPPVADQGQLGSCTANAGVALLEYFERSSSGNSIDASRLFLYKATRNLMGQTGDTGAFLRTTMQAMVLFGMPPEDYWPYVVTTYDNEPTAFCYAFAQSYKAIQYYRIDPPSVTDRNEILARIKTNLAAKLPLMFGFHGLCLLHPGRRQRRGLPRSARQRAPRRRPRHRRLWLRRRQGHRQCQPGIRALHGRPPHSELLESELGRRRLRLVAV